MPASVTSQGVTKLKELLFEGETERLADLSRRLELLGNEHEALRSALTERAAQEAGARADLSQRIDVIHERAGSPDRFSRAVSEVLDKAIERAERERHEELETALAPAVVQTVKAEILNSQDALVQALYPMTGQMVKAYVASAMKDLVNQVNRRLESNALMLRIKSMTTGRSMAELALAESQRLDVEELLLIRRGTGELIARWPDNPARSNHDHVMGGVLTAINSFATEALEPDENTLRQIDLGTSRVYLRSSPTYLLAAKCTGTAGVSIEQIIDDEFLATVAGMNANDERGEQARHGIIELGPRISERIEKQYELLDRPALGVSPIKLVAVVIGLPLLAWIGWSAYVTYETGRVRETARQVIETSPEIRGYPTTLAVAPRGRSLTISGLAPDSTALQTVLDRLAGALPGTAIASQVAVMPQGPKDRSSEITQLRGQLAELNREIPRRAALRALANAREGLREASGHLQRFADLGKTSDRETTQSLAATGGKIAPILLAAEEAVAQAAASLRSQSPDEDGAARLTAGIDKHAEALQKAIDGLAREASLIGVPPSPTPSAQNAASSATVAQPAYVLGAERLETMAQRLQLIAVSLIQSELTRAAIPKPPQQQMPDPTPRQKLAEFVRSHAIFFADNAEYRNAERASMTLDLLVWLMRDTDSLIRVIGYTDERGTNTRNSSLSQQRAEKVRNELIARGAPASRLVAVGRLSLNDISSQAGPQSPNRRVEFEVGFEGEGAP
ncbi:MAG: OmpA family protein [Hyphomicrobiaceae bacterium]